jgi:hypothetical protein
LRQAVVLQMQRSHGNKYTTRAIERLPAAANGSAVLEEAPDDGSRAQSALGPDPRPTDRDRHPKQNRVGPPGAARTAIPLKTFTRRPAPNPAKSTNEAGTESPHRDPQPSEAAESASGQSSQVPAPPSGTPPDPLDASAVNGQAPDGFPRTGPPVVTSAAAPLNALRRSVASRGNSGPIIQRDWLDDAADAVSDTASSVAGTISDVTSSAAENVLDVAGDVAGAVSDAAGAAADAIKGLLNSALDTLTSAFNAVVGKIGGAWDSVKTGVTKAVESAMQGAIGFLGGLGSLFGTVASALASLDVSVLKTAWAAVTGAAEAAVAGVRGIVAAVTATVDALWAGLKEMAESAIGGVRSQAEELIGRLPSAVKGAARSAWATIEKQLTSTWRTIESGWTSLRTSVLKGVTEVVAQVEAVAKTIKNAGVEAVIAALEHGQAILAFVRQVIANPDVIIEPIVQTVVGLLQDVPEKARTETQKQIEEQAGGAAPASTAPAPATAGAAPAPRVQRMAPAALPLQGLIQRQSPAGGEARTRLGFVETLSGVGKGIGDKLAALWADLWGQVKKMVIGVLDPREIAKGLGEDWGNMTKELSARAQRIEGLRTDSWTNFFDDLSRFISNILDFPLIVWRTINTMLGRLSVYIGLAIILGGAVMGAIAAGTGGAIFGSVIPAAGTAGGGIAGILAGAWAGATAGYAAAETVGLILLASFVAAEQISTVKAITDLLNIPQTEDEQNEDVNQASDSIIAMLTAGALILIAWMAVSFAKMVFAFLKGVFVRFRGGEPPPATTPKPVDVPINKRGFAICRSCLDPVKTPPDLLARRNALPADVGEFLDSRIRNNPHILKDPANPTPADFKAVKGIMDGLEKIGEKKLGPGRTPQEYLEAGLREQMPKVSAPIGDPAALAELPRLEKAMRQVVQEIDDFAKANPDKPNAAKMGEQLKSLLEGTFKDQLEGRQPITDHQVIGYDGQIKGAQGELAEAKLAPAKTEFNILIDGVEFDQVRPDGSLFQTKSLRAARGPSAKFPDGNGTYQEAVAQVKRSLEIAERPANLHNGQPRPVTIKFRDGLTKEVAADMKAITSPQGHKATIIAHEIVLDPI